MLCRFDGNVHEKGAACATPFLRSPECLAYKCLPSLATPSDEVEPAEGVSVAPVSTNISSSRIFLGLSDVAIALVSVCHVANQPTDDVHAATRPTVLLIHREFQVAQELTDLRLVDDCALLNGLM